MTDRAALLLKAAYLAGAGRSAREIADDLGCDGLDGRDWHALLKFHGTPIVQRQPGFVVRRVVLHHNRFALAVQFAHARGVDADDIATRVLDIVLNEPVLLGNLLDEPTEGVAP